MHVYEGTAQRNALPLLGGEGEQGEREKETEH